MKYLLTRKSLMIGAVILLAGAALAFANSGYWNNGYGYGYGMGPGMMGYAYGNGAYARGAEMMGYGPGAFNNGGRYGVNLNRGWSATRDRARGNDGANGYGAYGGYGYGGGYCW